MDRDELERRIDAEDDHAIHALGEAFATAQKALEARLREARGVQGPASLVLTEMAAVANLANWPAATEADVEGATKRLRDAIAKLRRWQEQTQARIAGASK